jgi:hypothetical protein
VSETVEWILGTWVSITGCLLVVSWFGARGEWPPYRWRAFGALAVVSCFWFVLLPLFILIWLFEPLVDGAFEAWERRRKGNK